MSEEERKTNKTRKEIKRNRIHTWIFSAEREGRVLHVSSTGAGRWPSEMLVSVNVVILGRNHFRHSVARWNDDSFHSIGSWNGSSRSRTNGYYTALSFHFDQMMTLQIQSSSFSIIINNHTRGRPTFSRSATAS